MVSPVEQVKPETIIPEQAGTLSPEPTKTVETPEPVSTPVAMSSDLNVTAEPSVTPSPEETPINHGFNSCGFPVKRCPGGTHC